MPQTPYQKHHGLADLSDLLLKGSQFSEVEIIDALGALDISLQKTQLGEMYTDERKSLQQKIIAPTRPNQKKSIEQKISNPVSLPPKILPSNNPIITKTKSYKNNAQDQKISETEKKAVKTIATKISKTITSTAKKKKFSPQKIIEKVKIQEDGKIIIGKDKKKIVLFDISKYLPDIDFSTMQEKFSLQINIWKKSIINQSSLTAEKISTSLATALENFSHEIQKAQAQAKQEYLKNRAERTNKSQEKKEVAPQEERIATTKEEKSQETIEIPLIIPAQDKDTYKKNDPYILPKKNKKQRIDKVDKNKGGIWHNITGFFSGLREKIWENEEKQTRSLQGVMGAIEWSDENFSSNIESSWEKSFSSLDKNHISFITDDGSPSSLIPIPQKFTTDAFRKQNLKIRKKQFQKWLDATRQELKNEGELDYIEKGKYAFLMNMRHIIGSDNNYVERVHNNMFQKVKNSSDTKYEYAEKELAKSKILPSKLQKILLGIPAQESQYYDNTVSSVGAYGPWQILPSTSTGTKRSQMKRHGTWKGEGEKLKDFSYATKKAIKYFEKQYSSIKNNTAVIQLVKKYDLEEEDFIFPLVLSSYHAGYGNAVSGKNIGKKGEKKKILGMASWVYQQQKKGNSEFAIAIKKIPSKNFYEFTALAYIESGYNSSYKFASFWYPIKVQALSKAIDPGFFHGIFSKKTPIKRKILTEKKEDSSWWDIFWGSETSKENQKSRYGHTEVRNALIDYYANNKKFFTNITYGKKYNAAIKEKNLQKDGYHMNYKKSGLKLEFQQMVTRNALQKTTEENLIKNAPKTVVLQNNFWRLKDIRGGKKGKGNIEKYCRTSEKMYASLEKITKNFQDKILQAGIAEQWSLRPIVTSLTRVQKPHKGGSNLSPHDYAVGIDFSRHSFDLMHRTTGKYKEINTGNSNGKEAAILNVAKTLFLEALEEFDNATTGKKNTQIMTIENNPPHYHIAVLPEANTKDESPWWKIW